jgi:putative redox protein
VPEKTVVARHEGGMRFVARTGSEHEVVLDSGDGGTGMRPTEAVIVGLTTCTAMDVVAILDKKRQAYDSYAIHARAQQRDEYPQVFTRIDIVHEVTGPAVTVEAVRRAIELSAMKYCPVSAMLSAGDTEVHHAYRVVGTGPVRFEETGEAIVTGPYARPDILAG